MGDSSQQVRTRRAFLAGGLGAAVAAVASAIGRPTPARGANGDPVLAGGSVSAANVTILSKIPGGSDDALRVYNPGGQAVHGDTISGTGVWGSSGGGRGVHGISNENYGVYGESPDNYAVAGLSSTSAGVAGFSDSGQGVIGASNTVGVLGQSGLGRGGRFSGKKAQIRLDPSTAATHPASGAVGDIFLDASKRLWLCKGGTSWVRLDT
jgi:hypothetical protein